MFLKVALFLLCVLYNVNSEPVATTQSPNNKYPPCNNGIIFGYDTTVALEESAYNKQVNFLTNYAFEEWNNFEDLVLFSYGNKVFKGSFKNKSELKDYILNDKRVNSNRDACNVFSDLYYKGPAGFKSFIIFLREFNEDDVDMFCNTVIYEFNSESYPILFVPLTSAVNTDDLKGYFPKATILAWDIDKDTPDDWKEQFNKNFGCDPQTTTAKVTTEVPTTTQISTSTEDPLDRYPCNNNIFIGYETTTKLAASRYQKQINFLDSMLFENWTHFDQLSVLSCGNEIFKKAGSFKSKSDLTEFIANDVQVKTPRKVCDILNMIHDRTTGDPFNVVLFLREFNQKDVAQGYCETDIDFLNDHLSSIAFVILTEDVIVEELEVFFSNAKIIKWDIDNKDAPDNWENQFYDAYGCNPQSTTTAITHTYLSTTTKNPADCCPCSKEVFIAYDKSNGLNGDEFKRLQDFLLNDIFKNWSSFNNLRLISYADNTTHDQFTYLKSKKMLESFIRNDKQVDKKPSLCEIFDRSDSDHVNIIFTSKFTAEDITTYCKSNSRYPDNRIDFITFVVMTDAVELDLLNEYYPQAQFIKWNVSGEETPKNWEWLFTEAYNCRKHDQQVYPCDNKILVGYDENLDTLNTLQGFFINNLFSKDDWNVFENLELVAYSEDMRVKSFGTMNNLNDVYNFINNRTKTTLTTSLCRVFYELASTYTLGVNIILFVSEFHEHQGDECPLWIEKVRNSANSITFVNLTKNVDTNYLLSRIPHANFISWPITEQALPNDWENQFFSAFGCESFHVESKTYPCLNDVAIAFDKSRHFSPVSYQRLTSFLLTKLFINEWTNFGDYLALSSYANETNTHLSTSLLQLKLFIHQNLKTEEEPKLCYAFQVLTTNPVYLILFVSKFDEDVLSSDCLNDPKFAVESKPKKITFFKLGPLVNETYILEMFPAAIIVPWNIEQEPEPTNWTQVLWKAFGCNSSSPIILPTTPAPTFSTTKPLTTTTHQITPTALSSPEQSTSKTTTTRSTTQTTTTTQLPSSNTSNPLVIVVSVVVPVIVIILIGVIACFCFYRRKQHQQLVANIASNNYYRTKELDKEREEDCWEISLQSVQINFLDKLGSGAFGDVYLGRIDGPAPVKNIYSDSPHCQRFHDCNVAIKSLPSTQVDEYARNEFLKEIEFMKGLKFHVNLVCFLGYVYDPTSPLMLLEYCANGDLLKFIKTNKQKFVESFETNADCKTLISFAWQISSGLEYLSSLDLIHRDIAARNILLDAQNVCKVSDFGLCRLAEDLTYQSKGGKLPIRWMALESLKDYVYSQKTDVWSYGVLLYELFSLGDLPYVHVENILAFIESGKRLEKPNYCSDQIYELMTSCWLVDPEERPTFTVICQILSKMLETATLHYNYVDTLALIEEANQIDDLNGEYDEINE